MTRIRITAALALGLTLAGTAALAQQTTALGKREYDSNCASCHGADGKGDGAKGEDGKPAEEEDLGKLLQKQMLEDAAKDSKDAAKPDGK